MNKPVKPNITIPAEFATNGVKTDFDNSKLTDGFDKLNPDVLAGDNLNKLIDDTYKGLNFAIDCVDDLYKGIVLYSATETYDSTSLVFDISGTDIKLYHSLVDNNLGNPLTDTTKWEEVQLGGGTRNIGEIVASTIPLTDAGLHLLDGSLLVYGSYKDFIDYIADLYDSGDYDDIFETEANWQTSVTTYGVCGKFVYDSVNNTVRLPKITGIVEGTTDLTALGDLVEAGLPNIKGEINTVTSVFTGAQNAFAVDTSATGTQPQVGSGQKYYRVNFDASHSNSIYGNSSTVQPQAIKVLYYIVIATTTKTAIEVDIDEIATDLNGKADVDGSNMVSSVKNFDGAWVESSLTPLTNVSIGTTARSVDLSSYLPDDDYDYFVCATFLGKPNTAGIVCVVVGDSGTQLRVRGSVQNVNTEGSGYIVVGNDRIVQCGTITGTWTGAELRFFAYRRIGTNQ